MSGLDQNSGDHPRSRGVYNPAFQGGLESFGSSPLARGLRGQEGQAGRRRRIIPARAGFTHPSLPNVVQVGDHPRSRGVYIASWANDVAYSGSSPLARGLHLRILGIPTMSHTTRPRLPSLPT